MSEFEEIGRGDGARLAVGDVVRIDLPITDAATGRTRTWQRFACVTRPGSFYIEALNLKLNPTKNDRRLIRLGGPGQERVFKIPEDRWPQGVVAMRMKLIMTKVISLGET